MADFYIDHNVSLYTAVELQRKGHSVITSREVHQERAPDYRQLLTAASQKRILVTHDEEDFKLLHGAWLNWAAAWRTEARHAGILVIPQWTSASERCGPVDAARELTSFVGRADSLANQLHVWRRDHGWLAVAL